MPAPRSQTGVRPRFEFAARIGPLVVDETAHPLADAPAQRATTWLSMVGAAHAGDRYVQFVVQALGHAPALRLAVRRVEIDAKAGAAGAAFDTVDVHEAPDICGSRPARRPRIPTLSDSGGHGHSTRPIPRRLCKPGDRSGQATQLRNIVRPTPGTAAPTSPARRPTADARCDAHTAAHGRPSRRPQPRRLQ